MGGQGGGARGQAPLVFIPSLSSIDCFFSFFAKFEFSIFNMFGQVQIVYFLENTFSSFPIPNIIIQIGQTNKHT